MVCTGTLGTVVVPRHILDHMGLDFLVDGCMVF